MAIGYLLGGIVALIYCGFVGYMGGIKRSPTILKLVKLKLGKGMSDDRAATICLVFAALIGALGIFLLVYGGVTTGT